MVWFYSCQKQKFVGNVNEQIMRNPADVNCYSGAPWSHRPSLRSIFARLDSKCVWYGLLRQCATERRHTCRKIFPYLLSLFSFFQSVSSILDWAALWLKHGRSCIVLVASSLGLQLQNGQPGLGIHGSLPNKGSNYNRQEKFSWETSGLQNWKITTNGHVKTRKNKRKDRKPTKGKSRSKDRKNRKNIHCINKEKNIKKRKIRK